MEAPAEEEGRRGEGRGGEGRGGEGRGGEGGGGKGHVRLIQKYSKVQSREEQIPC